MDWIVAVLGISAFIGVLAGFSAARFPAVLISGLATIGACAWFLFRGGMFLFVPTVLVIGIIIYAYLEFRRYRIDKWAKRNMMNG